MGISGWKDEMALGVPAIDEAHEALFQELARLGPVSYTHLTLPTNREV